jgi:hypothetical protein
MVPSNTVQSHQEVLDGVTAGDFIAALGHKFQMPSHW